MMSLFAVSLNFTPPFCRRAAAPFLACNSVDEEVLVVKVDGTKAFVTKV
jgi:hypothetical protein